MKPIKPTLIIDKNKAIKNINRMHEKARKAAVRFRPHFKTHQSIETGQWFKEHGIDSIAVSSVDMALHFFEEGWRDITIAILVNRLEMDKINRLAAEADIRLHLLVDSPETVSFLEDHLSRGVDAWIKIDTGYHRTGIDCGDKEAILALVKQINQSTKLNFRGLLTHSGHSYHPETAAHLNASTLPNELSGSPKDMLAAIYKDTVDKMNEVRDYLTASGIGNIEISIGDTPTCSTVAEIYGVDEIRPGNFIYYDTMQLDLKSCDEEDIAAAVACPVIARYPERKEIVIYGGAVHLSKESIQRKITQDGKKETIYGLVALPENDFTQWGLPIRDAAVTSLSQEHGTITFRGEFPGNINVGDILMVLPIHSCLTVNLLQGYLYNKILNKQEM